MVEKAYSSTVKERIQEALDLLQHRYDSDVLEFSARIKRAYPDEWQKLVNHWDQEFARMPVNVEVNVKIRRSGMTGPPLTKLDNEIKK